MRLRKLLDTDRKIAVLLHLNDDKLGKGKKTGIKLEERQTAQSKSIAKKP